MSVGRFPSGQREQTVNLPPLCFGGSNPPLPTTHRSAQYERGTIQGEGRPDGRPNGNRQDWRETAAAKRQLQGGFSPQPDAGDAGVAQG